MDVADDMAARRHVAFVGFRLVDIDNLVEKVGLAMLAAEVLVVRLAQWLSKITEGKRALLRMSS
jgi:hypothetical protein